MTLITIVIKARPGPTIQPINNSARLISHLPSPVELETKLFLPAPTHIFIIPQPLAPCPLRGRAAPAGRKWRQRPMQSRSLQRYARHRTAFWKRSMSCMGNFTKQVHYCFEQRSYPQRVMMVSKQLRLIERLSWRGSTKSFELCISERRTLQNRSWIVNRFPLNDNHSDRMMIRPAHPIPIIATGERCLYQKLTTCRRFDLPQGTHPMGVFLCRLYIEL